MAKRKKDIAMDMTRFYKNKKLIPALTLILVLLIAVLGARPAWYALTDLTFYWQERSETEIRVKAFAEEKGLFFAQYPKSLIDLLERNPETEDFVLNYPLREDRNTDLSGFDRREGVPLFLQWDPMWGYETYGSDFLAVTGCGPSCLAMAGYYLTGSQDMNPRDIAAFAERNRYYAPGYGSSWTLISEGCGKLGLTATELPLVEKKITNALEAGHPVILALGEGDFTTTGHYIVLTGMKDGAFTLNDPNSILRSRQLWTYEQLEGQIRNIWEISLPQ
ncbi:MAG: C39 family peptidase [Oscillospiraceae bacterium]|nr:C39 family peptidase [Oscillospiraceae bacterium]